ncbi:MAG: hypothetical protein ACPGSM_12220 [Thiolinea sp.]
MKQKLSIAALATALCASATTALADTSAPACSLATLKGSYIWDERTRTDLSWLTDIGQPAFEEHGSPIAHAVSVGHETNDGAGTITAGHMTINATTTDGNGLPEPFGGNPMTRTGYTGTVTVNADCTGTYAITLSDGSPGGGGDIYIDPYTGNFTMLDTSNIGIARFTKHGSNSGLHSPFPNIAWP